MNIDHLTRLLETWYEVEVGGLGLGAERTDGIRNPTLRKFYSNLGRLADQGTPWWRVDRQDSFVPLSKLNAEWGMTVFGIENQGCFVIAAADQAETNVFGEGDGITLARLTSLTDLGVPLEECLVTFAIRETIFTSQPLEREPTAKITERAKQGVHYRGRYVCDDVFDDFWLSEDVLLLSGKALGIDQDLVAPKGAWRDARIS